MLSLLLFALLSSHAVYSQSTSQARLLIYSATAGFRHDSIPTAIQLLQSRASSINVQFDATEDKSWFITDKLAQYDGLVFLSTTGEVLDDSGKSAFQKYINDGGNFVGIHSASDTLNTTEFFKKELGAIFDYHPEISKATVNVIGPSHPSTSKLPSKWEITDEMYNFKSDPRAVGAIVVLSADESTYNDPGTKKYDQGTPHPTAWYQEHGAGVEAGGTAGRSFYTSLGHLNETWQDDTFMAHVLGGIAWVLQSNTTRAFNASGLVGQASASASSTPTGQTSSSSPSPSNSEAHTLSLWSINNIFVGWVVGLVGVVITLHIFP